MTSPLGQYGAKGYESSESRTLGKFASDKFSYREQAKNIIELNNAVGYMSAYMRKMQRGIDEANQNFIQQIQGLINDFIVLLGGGGDTGFDFGDLKYVVQAIGSLFGFTNDAGEITLPVNLFEAAWHFFSSYILPVDNFSDAINFIVDGIIASALDIFGEVPIVGQALQQLAVIISDIRDLLTPIADAVQALFDAINLDITDLSGIGGLFGPLKPIWDAFIAALDGVNLPDFSAAFHIIAQWSAPFVQLIVDAINALSSIVSGAGFTSLTDLPNVLLNILSPLNAGNVFGTLLASVIPGLDVSKITTGIFGTGFIPNLAASKITSGTFGTGLIPSLDVSKITTGIFGTSFIPSLPASQITSGTFGAGLIPGLDVSKIITGTFGTGFIPSLDVSKITTGIFGTGFIPSLPASQITSGTFSTGLIPNITKAMSTDMQATIDAIYQAINGGTTTGNTTASVKTSLLNIPGGNIISALLASVIPSLDVSKITTGTFGTSFIPNLDVAKITTGVFGTGFIPSLDVAKITTGTFGASFIPNLAASKITSGTFATGLIPDITKGMSGDMQAVIDGVYQAINGGVTTGNTVASVKTALLAFPAGNVTSGTFATGRIPSLPASQITSGTFTTGLIPALDVAKITTGTFATSFIPNLDVAKITTGVFGTAFIPSLPAGQITSGTFATGLIPNVTKAMSTDMQAVIDAIYQAINGGVTTGNTVASVKTGLLAIPGPNIASAVAASIIPSLDVSKITTGTFGTGFIPSLPASQITSGAFATARIPDITKAMSGDLQGTIDAIYQAINGGVTTGNTVASVKTGLLAQPAANITSGTFNIARIPNLAASIITSGTFGTAQIPSLPASQITSGTFTTGLIPALDVAKITTGTFATSFIPNLDVAKITTGVFGTSFIPSLPASQITSGAFATARIPDITKAMSGDLQGTIDAIYQAINGGVTTGNTVASVKTGLLAQPAANITSGTFNTARIPNLAASIITSGTFGAGLIPSLPASQITSGTFGAGLIPSLPASQITSGTFGGSLIPSLDTSKIITGTFADAFVPGLSNRVLSTVFTSSAQSASNLIIDPGFDNATVWANEIGVMDTAQKVNGTQSRRTTSNGTVQSIYASACGGSGTGPIWMVQPGQKYYYEASVFPKATNAGVGTGTIGIVAAIYDSTGVNAFTYVLTPYFGAPPTKGQWTKYSETLEIPTGYDGMIPLLVMNSDVPSGDQFYWDRLVCREVTESQNWVSGFFNALTGQSENVVAEANASEQAAELAATLAANTLAISQLQSDATGSSNSGLSGGDDFERTSTSNLGGTSYWTETYATGTSPNDGMMAITDSHQAAWVQASVPTAPYGVDRQGLFRRTNSADQVTDTLYQKVSLTIGTVVGQTPTIYAATFNFTRIYARMNTAQTQYVFIELTGAPTGAGFKAQFGYKNGAGDVYVGSPVTCTQAAGVKFDLVAGTVGGLRQFQLLRNGSSVTSWNDSGNASAAVQGTNNGWGFGSKASTRNDGTQTYPSSIAGVNIADNTPPTLVGSGAHIVRTNTGSVQASGGINLLATNFFGSTSLATSDITVDLTNGKFTVTYAGWYQIELGMLHSTIFEAWNPVLLCNGTGVKAGGPRMANMGTYAHSCWLWYLDAGDYVQGGTYRASGTTGLNLTGEATGMWTYFSISLMNKSYL